MAPNCDICGRRMEPTAALIFWYPKIKADPTVFPWACQDCRTVSTEPEPHPKRRMRQMTKQAQVREGQRYQGWGKTWEVTRVANGRVHAFNVNRPDNMIMWPIAKFREATK